MNKHTDSFLPAELPAIDTAKLENVTGGCAACGQPGLRHTQPAWNQQWNAQAGQAQSA